METKDKLLGVVRRASFGSARSQQTKIGPSELGGCKREFWYKVNEPSVTNENQLVLASYMGTAIHKAIEQDFRDSDPESKRYLLETEVEFGGMTGHVDLYDLEDFEIIDWKTTKQKNQAYFPNKHQVWQVMVYGKMMKHAGYRVDKVSLASIARDGDERDLIIVSFEYDDAIADEALAWYKIELERMEIPEPEKDAETWCQHYCAFFGKCKGLDITDKSADLPMITDDMIVYAIEDYLAFGSQIKELEAKQDSAKGVLAGVVGMTPSGIKLTWSHQDGRETVDADAVELALGYVPKKRGEGFDKISVKAPKAPKAKTGA